MAIWGSIWVVPPLSTSWIIILFIGPLIYTFTGWGQYPRFHVSTAPVVGCVLEDTLIGSSAGNCVERGFPNLGVLGVSFWVSPE